MKTYTTQRELRQAFWEAFPEFKRTVVACGNGFYRQRTQNEYPADIRCAFVEWVDGLQKNGDISSELAGKVTL